MTAAGWLQIALLVVVLTAVTPVLGGYMARVFRGEPVVLERLVGPLERLLWRAIGVESRDPQDWKRYAGSVVAFSAVSWLVLFVILRTQGIHPWNPEGFGPQPAGLAFNTAASFVSNTAWQFYGGERTLSYFSQMAGITVQSFLSGGVGLAVGVAVIRGFAGRSGSAVGNFWFDLVRALLYVLLPLAVVVSLLLISQGTLQTLDPYVHVHGLTGQSQTLALGPVASQKAITVMGGDGGGFFNVNSAMPFENPSAITDFVQVVLILLIPAGLTATFGRMAGNRRQGWALYAVMIVMFVGSAAALYAAESHGTPAMHAAGVAGPNLEGKEQRFGVADSALFTAVTSAGGDGTVNASLDSLTGLGGSIPMASMMTGEVIFGAVGSGLYGMLLMVILTVFVAGLMVGRTPEYLGKKIDVREIKLTVIGVIAVPLTVIILTAIAIGTRFGLSSVFNAGPQGFSETLYAYTSQTNNNGSAFAGYSGYVQPHAAGNVGAHGIAFADFAGGIAMLLGRFFPMLVALAVAGSLAGKRTAEVGPGTLRTDNAVFVVIVIGTITVVALLTFIPALMLGPLVQALTGRLF
jgi:potassium-transporting ATPase potassium-binding subunit